MVPSDVKLKLLEGFFQHFAETIIYIAGHLARLCTSNGQTDPPIHGTPRGRHSCHNLAESSPFLVDRDDARSSHCLASTIFFELYHGSVKPSVSAMRTGRPVCLLTENDGPCSAEQKFIN